VSTSLLGGQFEVPDLVEPIAAWRVWRVVASRDGYTLSSAVKQTLWPARLALHATCLAPPSVLRWVRRTPPHPAPHTDCQCGIYGATLDLITAYLDDDSLQPAAARVLGRVALWGTVVECEHGYRASHAYPQHLYIPTDAPQRRHGPTIPDLTTALTRYGVPVQPLTATCSQAVQQLIQQAA
jgi:hypothetical protein